MSLVENIFKSKLKSIESGKNKAIRQDKFIKFLICAKIKYLVNKIMERHCR